MHMLSFQPLKWKYNQFRELTEFGTLQVANTFILLPSMALLKKKWRKEKLTNGTNVFIDHWIFSVLLDIQTPTLPRGTLTESTTVYFSSMTFLDNVSYYIIIIPSHLLLPGSCPQPASLQCHFSLAGILLEWGPFKNPLHGKDRILLASRWQCSLAQYWHFFLGINSLYPYRLVNWHQFSHAFLNTKGHSSVHQLCAVTCILTGHHTPELNRLKQQLLYLLQFL